MGLILDDSLVHFSFLSDPAHRESFESAHSVLLSIFANNGKRNHVPSASQPDRQERLAIRLAPFYLGSIIEVRSPVHFVHVLPVIIHKLYQNAVDGRLSIDQLRLAYHSLVRSTSASNDVSLTWYCIEELLGALRKAKASDSKDPQVKRLRLTLVSLVSAANLPLLPRLLRVVEIEMDEADEAQRIELAKEVHDEVMKRVGDAQKETALRWWLGLRRRWERKVPDVPVAL